jgi:hypothetical protein
MHLELAAVGDDDGLGGLARLGAHGLAGLDHVEAINHAAEHNVLAVEPASPTPPDDFLVITRK